MDTLELARRMAVIGDGGPIYREFIHDAVVHEPWNAYSSLFFLVPVFYWIWKLRGQFKEYKIFLAILPLLALNGIGSTLYHAFRTEPFFLMLDWMPATFMVITLSSYLWTKLLRKWYWGLLVVIGFYGVGILGVVTLIQVFENRALAPNFGYFFIGASFIVPLLILLTQTRFYRGYLVLLTFVFLMGALVARTLDYPSPDPFPDLLPQGTHFLWHILSALADFSLGYYVYYTHKIDLRKPQPYPERALPRRLREVYQS